jgi:hypothetical protein
MGESLKVKVVAATPGADTNVYVMFDSTVTFGVGIDGDSRNQTLNAHDISRVCFSLENSHLGTIRAYESMDKGLNWVQFGDDISVAAAGATDISGPYDFLVDTYDDVRISWVNGNSAQTTWRPGIKLIRGDRAIGT